jgi:hypothetical protein
MSVDGGIATGWPSKAGECIRPKNWRPGGIVAANRWLALRVRRLDLPAPGFFVRAESASPPTWSNYVGGTNGILC